MWSYILCCAFGCLVGIAGSLAAWLIHCKLDEDRTNEIICDADRWCENNCYLYKQVFENHEDPDEAWKALDKYCCNCPICEAQIRIFKDKY